jgi:hypothetical protein
MISDYSTAVHKLVYILYMTPYVLRHPPGIAGATAAWGCGSRPERAKKPTTKRCNEKALLLEQGFLLQQSN